MRCLYDFISLAKVYTFQHSLNNNKTDIFVIWSAICALFEKNHYFCRQKDRKWKNRHTYWKK